MAWASTKKQTSHRSTRCSRQLSSKGAPIYNKSTPEKTNFCQAFANFTRQASAISEEPFFFLVSSNQKKSLFFHTMLGIRKYSTLRLGCDLVGTKRMKGGTIRVELSLDKWHFFLKCYQLDSDGDSYSEVARGEINLNNLLKEKDDVGGKDICNRVLALRIGKNLNESYNATMAINVGVAPPPPSPQLRTIQRRLFNALPT